MSYVYLIEKELDGELRPSNHFTILSEVIGIGAQAVDAASQDSSCFKRENHLFK